ncbi:efflux RND transporter permease subunit [Phosphitispora fastidiosa]|uniref:efflux RND transporter permease subunit n=1 Tax=Phosphitispora fastidiosa TaxID=2837202 RepID=UPI001E5E3FD1|nr:efflux RND transporter permease subunit [Phosphitispora fastidiosa]MBU7006001.1 HAE1 family hydrophobic/amphiphilic exporter-1 [Phosphitispora fastidiosa]
MKISDFAVRRPVTISMIVLGIILIGVVSLGKLAIDLYPELNFPIAAVIANYPGAGPEEIENQVTRPLEEIMGTVNNVESVMSVSSPGSSMVLMMFNWGTDINFATLQMREKVDLIKAGLPDDVGTPTVLKMDPTTMPIIQAGVSGSRDLASLQQITEDLIKNRLERIAGVASVAITGGLVSEVEVKADPVKMDAYGLAVNQIIQTLQGENMNLSSGEIEDGKEKLLVRTVGELKRIEDFEEIVISGSGGVQVKLKDVAQIKFTHQEPTQYTRVNQKPSLSINILKQSGSNIVQVADKVNQEIENLQRELPSGVKIDIVVDQSLFIKDSISQMARNTISGGVLAVLVLLVFLRNFRSTLIIGLAIPFSVISTFILVYFAGITLNVMSLGGLALGVGMMVDSAIVILENIYRYRQLGHGYIDAAIKGSSEVGSAVMASTFTTVAVFLPIVFVEGLASELFKQLALTVTFSLLASLFVALTLIPMLSSKLLKVNPQEESARTTPLAKMANKVQGALGALDERYRRLLNWALQHRKTVVIGVTAALIGSFALIPLVGMEFMPQVDSGDIAVTVELPKGAVLEDTARIATEVEDIVNQVDEVKSIFTSIGSTGQMMGGSSGTVSQMQLKVGSRTERERSTDEIMEDLRKRLKGVTGAKITVSGGAQQQMAGGSPIDIAIKGKDLETLKDLSLQAVQVVSGISGTREVESSLEESRPEIQLVIDRQRAGQLGLTSSQVATGVRTAISGTTTSTYRVGGREYDIRIKVGENNPNLRELEGMTIVAPTGARVPLREVAEIARVNGPTSINREDQSRVVNITANVVDRDLGSVTTELKQAMDKVRLPGGYSIEYGGQNQEMMESFESLGLALILSIILVYMVMASQFESLMHPFVIMFSIPTTFIGVIGGLAVTGRSLSVPAFIGVIMLMGIVVNNAIVLVDYINTLRRRGMERAEAIVQAGPTRLRPILMTTLTTVLGLVPLALGIGEGAEAQAPMATVVVGGLTMSTLFTLVFVPVVYTIMDDAGQWFRKKRGQAEAREQGQGAVI